jgi:hypothetical protein
VPGVVLSWHDKGFGENWLTNVSYCKLIRLDLPPPLLYSILCLITYLITKYISGLYYTRAKVLIPEAKRG